MALSKVIAVLMLLSTLCFLTDGKAVHKSAHDLIMDANRHLFTKREAKSGAAEDDIIKINQEAGQDLFEGDILMSKEEIKQYYEGSNKRNFMKDMRYSWTTRTIPYYIEHTSGDDHTKIKAAMAKITSKVPCLTFRPRQYGDETYIRFTQDSTKGCWSSIGKRFPSTPVHLTHMCMNEGTIIHEILHALGFFHEQSRPDRDSFVTINYENIQTGQEYNFKRLEAYESIKLDTMYDYKSILHYSKTTFNSNGKDTMNAKFDPAMPLGSQTLSETDILELNKVYQCHLSSSQIWSEWTTWSACYTSGTTCRSTRQRYCFSSQKSECTGADSYGVKDEHRSCTSCLEPMDGHWNNWGSWGSCSKACDEGTRTRYRSCTNPSPSNGGKACPGSNSETRLCIIKKCNQKWYDTSFEDGWGMWKQSYTDSGIDWQRHTGSTHTPNTGPDGDHTTGGGYYAYVEAGVIDHKKFASLISSEIPANFGKKCISFFYSMNGKDMGKLEIILRFKSGTSMWLWEKEGHQGKDWKAAAVSAPEMTEPYTIEIKATIGYSPYSDIAIDDFFIHDGWCSKGMETCADHDQFCDYWSKRGECHKNWSWMLKNCCKSCSGIMAQCTTDSYGAQCVDWAKNTGCTDNGEWMWKNCCKSCKDCMDSTGYCSYWASIGECAKNPTWMKENCKVSCNVCKA